MSASVLGSVRASCFAAARVWLLLFCRSAEKARERVRERKRKRERLADSTDWEDNYPHAPRLEAPYILQTLC